MTFQEQIKRYKDFIFLRKNGWTVKNIAKKYGISRQAVEIRIVKGFPKIGTVKNQFHNQFYKFVFKKYGLRIQDIQGKDRTRMVVRARDNFKCRSCGKKRTPKQAKRYKKRLFDVHHLNGICGKKSKSYDSIKNIDKLITICHKCHYQRNDFAQK